MSHSVVKDFPTQTDNTLILVVNKNGELSVDKETLDGYASKCKCSGIGSFF